LEMFVTSFIEFGISNVTDLCDMSLITDAELMHELGMSKMQVRKFKRLITDKKDADAHESNSNSNKAKKDSKDETAAAAASITPTATSTVDNSNNNNDDDEGGKEVGNKEVSHVTVGVREISNPLTQTNPTTTSSADFYAERDLEGNTTPRTTSRYGHSVVL
jgi:hydroxymethylpyrimidine pyrophosphatase-like HAD family hydrolase